MQRDGSFLGFFLDWSGIIAIASAGAALLYFFFGILNVQKQNTANIDQMYDELTGIRAELTKIMYSLGRLEGKLGVYNNDADK